MSPPIEDGHPSQSYDDCRRETVFRPADPFDDALPEFVAEREKQANDGRGTEQVDQEESAERHMEDPGPALDQQVTVVSITSTCIFDCVSAQRG